MTEDKSFRDIMRHIITDEVVEAYSDARADFKSTYLIKSLLKTVYSRKRDIKHYWRRIDALFNPAAPVGRRNATDIIYETDEFRFPIQTVMELEELDRKVRTYPHIKAEVIEVMKDFYISADRNNTQFFAKLVGKDCMEECSWSAKSRKKNRLMDYTIFNELYPRTMGLQPDSKQMEDLFRTALNQIRHRYYSRRHRENQKLMLAESMKQLKEGNNTD